MMEIKGYDHLYLFGFLEQNNHHLKDNGEKKINDNLSWRHILNNSLTN